MLLFDQSGNGMPPGHLWQRHDPAPLRLAAQLAGPGRGLGDALSAADRGPQEWSSWAVVAQLAGKDKALVTRACALARSENPRLQSCP